MGLFSIFLVVAGAKAATGGLSPQRSGFFSSPQGGLANGSRERAPDDRLRVIRHLDSSAAGYGFA